jgi:membrane protein DedA with SNARE-associated domain
MPDSTRYTRYGMIEKFIALLGELIKGVIGAGGYKGIVALLALNSSGIPIPSEVILPFSGYLVHLGRFNLILVAAMGAIGCNIGSAIAYWIGAKGGRPLVERYGKWVLMSHHDLDRMTGFFDRFGSITILVGRMLPIVQTYVAFPAGIAKMSRLRFHIYTTLGSLIWYFCLAWAGMKLGAAWDTDPRMHEWFHRFHLVVLGALAAGVVWFVWSHVIRARNRDTV